MQRSSEIEHTGHEKELGRVKPCSVAFQVEGNTEMQSWIGTICNKDLHNDIPEDVPFGLRPEQ